MSNRLSAKDKELLRNLIWDRVFDLDLDEIPNAEADQAVKEVELLQQERAALSAIARKLVTVPKRSPIGP